MNCPLPTISPTTANVCNGRTRFILPCYTKFGQYTVLVTFGKENGYLEQVPSV